MKAREYALGCSWDAVFDRVYAGYETALLKLPMETETTQALEFEESCAAGHCPFLNSMRRFRTA